MNNEHELLRSTYKRRKQAMRQTDFDTTADRLITFILLAALITIFVKFLT